MTETPLQVVGSLSVVVAVAAVAVVAVTVSRGVEIVDSGDPKALVVMGEYRSVLEPGLNVYPPFVSRTFPVDPATLTVDTGRREFEVPPEHYPALRAHGIDPTADDDHDG